MDTNTKKRVLSAIQPTGDMHLGNYFGAVRNWVAIQDKYACTYGVVNYHSMTMPYKPSQLSENNWKMAMMLIACGVRPEYIFIQSMIPEHAELAWILGCNCSFGELSRMTQFKDKSDLLKENEKESAFVSAGLFYYPVLQAADILIYHADFVPVGKDQEQHLELSRNIAGRFNRQFGKEYFVHPEPLYTEIPKLLSLADPTRKMSKSHGEKHYVNLFGDPDRIRKQVRSAVTDTGETTGNEMSPGVANLFELLKACDKTEIRAALMEDHAAGALKYVDLKEAVADALVELTTPLRERLQEIQADKKRYKAMLQDSSANIRLRAQQTLRDVKELCGLANVKN